MNAQQQKEFEIKKQFILDNMKEKLAGGEVPGLDDALLWVKQMKNLTRDLKAEEAKKEAIKKHIKAERQTEEYKEHARQHAALVKNTKGFW